MLSTVNGPATRTLLTVFIGLVVQDTRSRHWLQWRRQSLSGGQYVAPTTGRGGFSCFVSATESSQHREESSHSSHDMPSTRFNFVPERFLGPSWAASQITSISELLADGSEHDVRYPLVDKALANIAVGR